MNIKKSLDKFIIWLEAYGYYSYDKDDILDSKFGVYVKKIFYKNKFIGAPLAAFVLIQETFFPKLIRFYSEKRREAIGDANYALGFLNLYEVSKDIDYLNKSEELLSNLLETSVDGYSGYCWGYSKGWQHSKGFWPANTPCITVTPYCYWAFKKHHQLTRNPKSLDVCKSIAKFVYNDLHKIEMPNGTYSAQYSTLDKNGNTINSTAYRASILYDAYKLTGIEEYRNEAEEHIDFILSYQQADGSWFYQVVENISETHIDNFHTCFVLKNLFLLYKMSQRDEIKEAVLRGYQYYKNYLLTKNLIPIHYSFGGLPRFRKEELYDYAEAINLFIMLRGISEDSFKLAQKMAEKIVSEWQTKKGYYVTRITTLNTKHKEPYHRWAQSQIFQALTLLYKEQKYEERNIHS